MLINNSINDMDGLITSIINDSYNVTIHKHNNSDYEGTINLDLEFYENELNNKVITDNIDIELSHYKKITNNDNLIKENKSCSICLNNYKINEYTRTLKCNHTFHKECIDKWAVKNRTCPLCRDDCVCSTI